MSEAGKRCQWTQNEDELLRGAVAEHGATKWNLISSIVPNHSGKQCRERWMSHLRPDLNKSRFTAQEDVLLVQIVHDRGTRWSELKDIFPTRSACALKNRYFTLVRHDKAPKPESWLTNIPISHRNDAVLFRDHPLQQTLLLNTPSSTAISPAQQAPSLPPPPRPLSAPEQQPPPQQFVTSTPFDDKPDRRIVLSVDSSTQIFPNSRPKLVTKRNHTSIFDNDSDVDPDIKAFDLVAQGAAAQDFQRKKLQRFLPKSLQPNTLPSSPVSRRLVPSQQTQIFQFSSAVSQSSSIDFSSLIAATTKPQSRPMMPSNESNSSSSHQAMRQWLELALQQSPTSTSSSTTAQQNTVLPFQSFTPLAPPQTSLTTTFTSPVSIQAAFLQTQSSRLQPQQPQPPPPQQQQISNTSQQMTRDVPSVSSIDIPTTLSRSSFSQNRPILAPVQRFSCSSSALPVSSSSSLPALPSLISNLNPPSSLVTRSIQQSTSSLFNVTTRRLPTQFTAQEPAKPTTDHIPFPSSSIESKNCGVALPNSQTLTNFDDMGDGSATKLPSLREMLSRTFP